MPQSRTGARPGAIRRRIVFALFLAAGTLAAFPTNAVAADPDPVNPIARARFYVQPRTHAARQADAWRRSRPRDAALIERIASQPQAVWFGEWNRDVRADVDALVGAASAQGAVPVLVAYNIPQRDCGLYSAGGARGADNYRRWIRAFAAGIRNRGAVVILEPDATMVTDCLSPAARQERFRLLGEAVDALKGAGATVYVDGGSPTYGHPEEMAARLRASGIDRADGFSLNVSNFIATPRAIAAGEQLSRRLGGKHFVIDTSRNGAGTATGHDWCNAQDQALGAAPTTRTGHALVDAFLWIKHPGESDGTCNGGPEAGGWWADYALNLVRRAG
ncbi:glycoside hydrolase family 6 protein [Longimicrobium sp.]|uniref:glycoside hydrolase family 6 protein n=1 Tax=Longimicrobium sp. TaxID=2029185 RepID=UPI002E36E6E9|nr:glycoside hydrolase family 6 protein [Longimicrobium sp.]HEX6038286.1 glycoside hydrolase family 6 protein [Longimicrobium sp.]